MKKWMFIFLSFLVIFSNLHAQDINFEEVKKVANNFLTFSSKTKNYSQDQEIISFSEKDTNLLYLIHNNADFIIIANDMRVQPILGYTDEGSFDGGNFPPQLLELIESYKSEILSLKRGKSSYKKSYKQDWDKYLKGEFESQKTSVAPFIKVNWNQGSGWNRYCPEDPDGPGGRVYVGCVAVSMAQSMSVYEHPDVGVGQSSYLSDYGQLTVNHGETEYNWDLMSNSSSDDYNSLLLYHCAVAVNMGFGPDGSGAYTTDIADALKHHFDYSSDVYSARSTEDDAWIELLKAELDEGRPISYGGNDGLNVGHAYNLDGYNNSNSFHVNWGWSGSYNGYFQITGLTPGGSDYSQNAKAVLNIKPMDHSPYDIILSTTKFKETLKVGDIGAIIDVLDPDDDDVHTLSVKGTNSIFDEAYCPFYIDGDSIKISEVLDSEQYKKVYIEISALDSQGNEFKKEFTIDIIKDNSPPTGISISIDTFDDTLSIGTFIATFTTIDPDEVDTFSYVFEKHENTDIGKDNSKFIIQNDSLITNYDFTSLDGNQCSIYIKSSDKMNESVTKEIILRVNKVTGLFNKQEQKLISIYPNPSINGVFNINMSQYLPVYNGSKYTVNIYNLQGQLKKSEQGILNQNNIQFKIDRKGMYLVQVTIDGVHFNQKILY